ncbi:MAG: hypothetical protein JXM70_09955 [Pirellulales bacterium]|nr:hypothetical protein [Pirellulales bacterium]
MADMHEQSNGGGGLFARLGRALASPWVAAVAVGIALLLTFRSVDNGLELDDFFHRAVLTGSERFGENMRGPQSMFRFLPGDPEQAKRAMDDGFLPWWTDPWIKAEFFQLIPTQTHILDYWLWPERPELMHVHNLAWFALLVLLAARFYRRLLGPTWMAGVAALLFAVEDAHGTPAGWICNRNILIAASFGIGCLIAHDVWRRDGRRWALGLAVALWAASLCSKEAGIATCAYLFAYAVWLDDSTPWRRFLTLVPYGIVLVGWRVVRDLLGFGVANIGYYVDPITDPGRFAEALLARYPVMLFGQWAGLSELSVLFSRLLGSPLWWISIGYIGVLGVLFFPLLRRDRVARFFATGMLLAVVPICATFPSDRLLTFVGLGALGLLVQFWHAVFAADGPRPELRAWRVAAIPVAVLLVLIHVVAAPVILAHRATGPLGPREMLDACYVNLPFDDSIEEQDLVVVNPPVPMMASYCLLIYDYEGMPSPRAIRTLTSGMGAVTVRRVDDCTLEVEPELGYLTFLDRLFRTEQHPLHVGDRVELARMTATVQSVADDRPRNVAFRFETPLEDRSLRWLRFQNGQFVPWAPPKVGEEVTLEPALKYLFGK